MGEIDVKFLAEHETDKAGAIEAGRRVATETVADAEVLPDIAEKILKAGGLLMVCREEGRGCFGIAGGVYRFGSRYRRRMKKNGQEECRPRKEAFRARQAHVGYMLSSHRRWGMVHFCAAARIPMAILRDNNSILHSITLIGKIQVFLMPAPLDAKFFSDLQLILLQKYGELLAELLHGRCAERE